MLTNKIKKTAFTLAEVLVTLMIIGVIAAMTVPTLKKSADMEEYVTGCKKLTLRYLTLQKWLKWTMVM